MSVSGTKEPGLFDNISKTRFFHLKIHLPHGRLEGRLCGQAIRCMQLLNYMKPACVAACPVGALYFDPARWSWSLPPRIVYQNPDKIRSPLPGHRRIGAGRVDVFD